MQRMSDPPEKGLLNAKPSQPILTTKSLLSPTMPRSAHLLHVDNSRDWVTHNNKPHIYGEPRHVDINVLKRNMSIAKGFMDISLLTANANQLRNLLQAGDSSTSAYHIVLVGLILSLVLQVLTGVLLIAKERFDLNFEDDQDAAVLYNNVTTMFVLFTLLINIFVSSFGIDFMRPRVKLYQVMDLKSQSISSAGGGSLLFPTNVTIVP